MTDPAHQKPNVREMVVIHNCFRKFYGEMPGLVRSSRADDARAAAVIADHVELGVKILHDHHGREDEALWPLLLDRVQSDTELVQHMQDQHAELTRRLDAMGRANATFRRAPSPKNREALAAAIASMVEVVEEHMAEEESRILPICERTLTPKEWDDMAGGDPPSIKEMAALLPALEGNNTSADVDLLLASLPTPVRAVIIPLIVRPMAGRYQRRLQGTTA